MRMTPKLITQIAARLSAESAKNLSDEELERTLRGCVSGNHLVEIAKRARDENILSLGLFYKGDPEHDAWVSEKLSLITIK